MIKCTQIGVEPSNTCYEICVMAKRCGALKAWEREHKNGHIEQTEREGRVMEDIARAIIELMLEVKRIADTMERNEPQMETEIARAIVHKMIDDAVIAEDARCSR